MNYNRSHFMAQPSQSPGLLDMLGGNLTQSITSQLPSQGQVVGDYLGAVVAFWVVGGITLYLVGRFSK